MATLLRNIDPMAPVVADAINGIKAQIGAGSKYHLDAYESPISHATLSGVTAADELLAIHAANQQMSIALLHEADALAHITPPTPYTFVRATTLATAYTLANAVQTWFNAHNGDTGQHYNADTNNNSTTVASTLSTLQTLLNALKTAINTHMADAPSAHSIRLIDA